MVFLEPDYDWDVKPLPGSLTFPAVTFSIKPGDSFSIVLEITIDIQLEGDSHFCFGTLGGLISLFFRAPRWRLDPA